MKSSITDEHKSPRDSHAAQVSARLNPWEVLGVEEGATEKDIKKAHRRLVLKHHPDRASQGASHSVAEAKFIAIQEAYEILIGKRRGKELDGLQSQGWDWHDWYWRFASRRRRGQESSPFPPKMTRDHWREQLNALKVKAAARAQRQPRRGGVHVRQEYARQNARAKERQQASQNSAPRKKSLEKEQNSDSPSGRVQPSSLSELQREVPEAHQQMAADGRTPPDFATLLVTAAHVVRNAQKRHDIALQAHAHRFYSHIMSLGDRLAGRLSLHQSESATIKEVSHEASSAAKSTQDHTHEQPQTVGDMDLHRLFQKAVQRMEESDAAHTGCNTEEPHADDAAFNVHARKFANREEVQSRLSNQLAGLKRRAALKHEV